jgi:hypothetical protein
MTLCKRFPTTNIYLHHRMWENEAGGPWVHTQTELYSKTLAQRTKDWVGGVARVVEPLCKKRKPLSSNHSKTKNKQHQQKRQWLSQVLVAHTCILATWETEISGTKIWSQLRATSSREPISKVARTKLTGGVAQVAEDVLCKHEALSSNCSPIKEKTKTTTKAWGCGSVAQFAWAPLQIFKKETFTPITHFS